MKKLSQLSQGEWVAVSLAIIVIVGLIFLTGVFQFPSSEPLTSDQQQNQMQDQTSEPIQNQPPVTTTPDLKVEDTTVGTGAEAVAGKSVSVEYTGMLTNGTVFDATSLHGGAPFTFMLGAGQVIQGWDVGVVGMKVGGERKLTIPSSMAYGPQGISDPSTGKVIIPGGATLVFTVKLLGVK